MKVLIVEDNALVAMMLEDELRNRNHEVLGPAATADEARELVRDRDCDCAFVDIDLLDGRTGGEIAAELCRRGTPVIFATGQPELAESYSDCALGALIKPIDPQDLLDVVDGVGRHADGSEPRWPARFRSFR